MLFYPMFVASHIVDYVDYDIPLTSLLPSDVSNDPDTDSYGYGIIIIIFD